MNPLSYFSVVDQTIEGGTLVPLYITETQFSEGLGGRYPTMVGDYGWIFFLDTDLLKPSQVERTRVAMRGLETDIGSRFSRSLVISRLDRTIAEYKSDLTLARASLFLFISLVVVVIMYFLALVMGLLAQRRSDEASLLTSRGASVLQVSGLLVVAEGAIVLVAMAEAELVELRRRKIGFIFQSFGLMPLLSAFENIELPLHIGGTPWRERRKRTSEALEMVGLGARARHRPYELSGGEQQRVAIARALVTGPDVVFADEPTGELDSSTANSILSILRDIATYQGVTVIVATHDFGLEAVADRAVVLIDGTLQE